MSVHLRTAFGVKPVGHDAMRFFIEAGDNREVIRECFRDKRVFDPFCPDAILHQSTDIIHGFVEYRRGGNTRRGGTQITSAPPPPTAPMGSLIGPYGAAANKS